MLKFCCFYRVADNVRSGFHLRLYSKRWYSVQVTGLRNLCMTHVTVSPKFQIVIPEEVRRQAGIQPGQKLAVFHIGAVIELAPVKDVKTMRGSLPGLNVNVAREADDRV